MNWPVRVSKQRSANTPGGTFALPTKNSYNTQVLDGRRSIGFGEISIKISKNGPLSRSSIEKN